MCHNPYSNHFWQNDKSFFNITWKNCVFFERAANSTLDWASMYIINLKPFINTKRRWITHFKILLSMDFLPKPDPNFSFFFQYLDSFLEFTEGPEENITQDEPFLVLGSKSGHSIGLLALADPFDAKMTTNFFAIIRIWWNIC